MKRPCPGAAVVEEPVLEQEESGEEGLDDLTYLAFFGLMGCVTDCEEAGEALGEALSKLEGMVNSVNSLFAEGLFTDGEESAGSKSDAGTVNVRSLWDVLPTMSMGTEVDSVSVVESLSVEL